MSLESELWGERLDLIGMIFTAITIGGSVVGSLIWFAHWLTKWFTEISEGLSHMIRTFDRFAEDQHDEHDTINATMTRCEEKMGTHGERIASVETKVDTLCVSDKK